MKTRINGESREVPDGSTIADLLTELRVDRGAIAVARNGRVVRRATFDATALADGDDLEIIRAVAGG